MKIEIPNRLTITTMHYDPNGPDDNEDFIFVAQSSFPEVGVIKLTPHEARLIGYIAEIEFPEK